MGTKSVRFDSSTWAASNEGLHQTVARISRHQPTAVAIVADAQKTTYAQLDAQANALAAALVASGVRPGECVPIAFPRSTELVALLLAVLKTGAAYALIDPTSPAERIGKIVDTLAANLIVTRNQLLEPRATSWAPPSTPPAAPASFRPVPADGNDPCCVFFTSGTTGEPKGVLTPHRATSRLFKAGTFAHFSTETIIPLAAPVPWDAFSLELWSALLNGGTSVVVDEPFLSAGALRTAVAQHDVNTVWLTSSLFNMIVDEDVDAFVGLNLVMTGGERLSTSHVARFLQQHPAISLLNGYGPVESTIFATTHSISPEDCTRHDGIPLGHPVPGTTVHVLDNNNRPCPPYKQGEICIAGDGLAIGYVGDPSLTANKFCHVDLEDESTRVYRTGDLGFRDTNGSLHFLGRADRQVKIRGHRVEPAEVERQIEQLLPVRSCRAVPILDDEGIVSDLIAFCVPTDEGDSLEGATQVLSAALTSFHQPASIISVPTFPLTAQGKLDEQALLKQFSNKRPSSPERPARTDLDPVTLAVHEVFCGVLEDKAIPIDQSFFDHGGTSLEAGRVCARLSTRLDRPVPLSRFYQYPSIASLAEWLRSTPPSASPSPSDSATVGVPLAPMQLVFLARSLANPSDRTGHCLLAWVIEGDLNLAALDAAIAAVHTRHEALQAAYVPDPRPHARLIGMPPPPVEVTTPAHTVLEAQEAVRSTLATDLKPSLGDIWRVAIGHVESRRTAVLGCAIHHIAFDGWSESVLASDLSDAYNAAMGDSGASQPAPPSLAAAHEARKRFLDQVDLSAVDDIVEELTDVPTLNWPGAPAESVTTHAQAIDLLLGPSVAAAVDSIATRYRTTRFVVLLSQYAAALAEVTGLVDFAVGVPIRQRYGGLLEDTIGCHINMTCVRFRGSALGGNAAATRETIRLVDRAFCAQDIPFPEVLRRATTSREAGRPPLFQNVFAFHDNPAPILRLQGLKTVFVRQSYLDLPVDLHAEVWPEGGDLRLSIAFRPQAVPHHIALRLAEAFAAHLDASCKDTE